MTRCTLALLVAVPTAASLAGCHGPGPYGHSATYAPTSDEESAVAGVRDYDPVMAAREPEAWRRSKVSLFGVVTSRAPGAGGQGYLTLSVRKLETRNLCSNGNDESSCRVTVSDRDFGVLHALVPLRAEDDMGEQAVGIGSLVRLVGTLGEDVDSGDGAPVLRASYCRHWPRHYYVTKAAAEQMRQ